MKGGTIIDTTKKISLAEKIPLKISLITIKFQNSFNRLVEKTPKYELKEKE